MRKFLNGLYEKIRNYEKEKDKAGKEVEKIKGEITNLSTSLSFTDNLSKIEKMKKQMDLSFLQSKLELAEMEKENSSNSNLLNLQNDVISKIKEIEENIYVAIRLNDLKYFISFEKLKEKYGEKNYKASSIKTFFENNFKDEKIETNLEILPELSSIYEYYKKISDVENEILNSLSTEDIREIEDKIEKIKKMNLSSEQVELRIKGHIQKLEPYNRKVEIHKQKLNMLEELIDEMATEVIREDMKKNNVTLPEFVKGMKYFKTEGEEKIEDSEIVD